MAKGARSKVKKRLRNARAEHLWKMKGQAANERMHSRLMDPNYTTAQEYRLAPNAFVEPDNPLAVFPQVVRQDLIDYRCHKMEKGGQTAIGTFRKLPGTNARVSKYRTMPMSIEDYNKMEMEKLAKKNKVKLDQEGEDDDDGDMEEDKDDGMQYVQSNKVTVEELAELTSKMSIDKKRQKKAEREAKKAEAPSVNIRSKKIKKERKKKSKSQKQLRFS